MFRESTDVVVVKGGNCETLGRVATTGLPEKKIPHSLFRVPDFKAMIIVTMDFLCTDLWVLDMIEPRKRKSYQGRRDLQLFLSRGLVFFCF